MKQIYAPNLEWELKDLPIVTNLKFERSNWGFNPTATISIWRDGDYKLKGKISGLVKDFEKLNKEHFAGKGNIILGQTVTGIDAQGNTIEMHKCFCNIVPNESLQHNYAEGILEIDSIKLSFLPDRMINDKTIRFDWFVCKRVSGYFFERTLRDQVNNKIRVGIDEYNDSDTNIGDHTKDYLLVDLPDYKLVVAKVPETLLPDGMEGLCLEFRGNLDDVNSDVIDGISNFISFLMGNEVIHLGYTIACGDSLVEVCLNDLNDLGAESIMPPIRFNLKYEWGNLTYLLNRFLPQYLSLKDTLRLNGALSMYWISKTVPLGVNLPILATAVESIANAYLENKDFATEYMSEETYLELIKTEKEQIEHKLSSVEGGEIILNKILGAFRKGPNEKMNTFIACLKIEIGKEEKKAIALRNKMAHSSIKYSKDEKAHNDLVLTRVYQVLFHRILLKLLGYDGYYIDYSSQGCPLRYIDRKAGESKNE